MIKMLIIIPLFIGTSELLIIAAIVLLLFGGKKIPEAMRGLGRGVKSFKKGMQEDFDLDSEKDKNKKEREVKNKNKKKMNSEKGFSDSENLEELTEHCDDN